MNPHKLNQRQQERNEAAQRSGEQAGTVREFATPEELLRHDAARVVPPENIGRKLDETLRREAPAAPWWKRLFGR